MTMQRRRFLTLAAAALAATPARAGTHLWQGRALGADATITLTGTTDSHARQILTRITRTLSQVEAHFSLHRDSALSRLNRDRRLAHPGQDILDLFALADRLHRATAGAFDPSIQPLYIATATGADPTAAVMNTGWQRVRITPDQITLDPGMALTFNGIAQGHAADRIARLLRDEGLADVLIDLGETRALGRRPDGTAWQAAIATPDGRTLTTLPLATLPQTDRALATSSPMGTRIGTGQPHILHPQRRPLWSTVAVTAASAALADGLSTAFCLMDRAAIDATLRQFPDAHLAAIS